MRIGLALGVTAMLLVAAAARAGDLDDLGWREDCADAARWSRQPGWLGNASPTAAVTSDGQTACFRVDEPVRGMKWSLDMPQTSLDRRPWLAVRYRAEALNTQGTDYFIYASDRVPGRQLGPLRLCDAKSDGRWHVAAVDLGLLTDAASIDGLAVQVQAGAQGKAAVWIDWIALAAEPPPGAEIVRHGPAAEPRPDWIAPLDAARWTAQPKWLGNPATDGAHSIERAGESTVFRVQTARCGMKWSWDLAEPVDLAGRRYVSIRYRARGASPASDYWLCVFGKPAAKDDPGYTAAVSSSEIIADGRWHVVNADLRGVAARYPAMTGMAVQLQASAPGASLEITDLRLTNALRPSRLADVVDWSPGSDLAAGFRPVPLGDAARSESASWRRHLHLADWFQGETITACGVPFVRTAKEPELAATPLAAKGELRLPAAGRASEVYLLLLAALVGDEEPAFGEGRLRAIRDVDRFRVRLEYADGTADECLPMNVLTREFGVVEGTQVLVAAADAAKDLRAVVACDRCKQGAFAVVGATLRADPGRRFPEAMEDSRPLMRVACKVDKPAWETDAAHPPVLLKVDGRAIAPPDLERLPQKNAAVGGPAAMTWHSVRGVEGLLLGVDLKPAGNDSFRIAATVRNDGPKERTVVLVAPSVGPYRLSDKPEDAYYLVPRCGSVLDNRPISFRERYSGQFPVQFLDTFCPAEGRGLTLRTEDTACLRKDYLLEKQDGAFTLGVEYPDIVLKPGESFTTAPAVVAGTDGDWRRGLEAYRAWVRTWHKPLSPRKPWFREVFNFRQRFLWGLDPLVGQASQPAIVEQASQSAGERERRKVQLHRAVDEARREFGGIDYLHLFDWGYVHGVGRIYGRTGDLDPYETIPGGREALRNAIAGVQAQGVPVGLYIEGYLLEERGRLGGQHGRAWQLVGHDGKGMYWPQCSEMFICPGVAAWREVQASTYAAKVCELGVDGMYIDEFGFANSGKDCWSREHGHPAPSYPVVTERDCTRTIRSAIDAARPNVAVYTEETPVDVTTQYQDGSFSYAMRHAQLAQARVPLNVARFALPDFKTIQILYCDKPTGSWATGVRWVFFNGEAIWLEGPGAEWFEPETREEIRRCYAILREHRDAFTSLEPEPLVPTELGGVWAHRFPSPGKTVYTLYNTRHRTVRGPVLRLAHRDGASYYDAWHNRPAAVTRDGPDDLVHLEVGPHGAGCLVVSHERPKP